MSLEAFTEKFPDYSVDIKLNLITALSDEGSPGLNQKQILGTALACAYAVKSKPLQEIILQKDLSLLEVTAAKAAASLMAMNNVYYRFLHMTHEKEISKMPARLRMNFISKPGIDKVDFEIYCLAVSAINGCGMCINAHTQELKKADISLEGIQSTVRIASVISAAHQVITIENL